MRQASIVGCGWVGLALAERWTSRGIHVTGTTTRFERLELLRAAGVEEAIHLAVDASFSELPVVDELLVITIPPGRRSVERLAVYPQRLQELAARTCPTAKVVFLSSTGVYGEGEGEVDETAMPAPATESARAVLEAEHLLRSALGARLCILRLAGLVGPGRHPGKWFAGKQNAANGDAPVNLVHRDDVLDAIDVVIAQNVFGDVLNVVAAEHPRKRDYYAACSAQLELLLPTFKDGGADAKRVDGSKLYALLGREIKLPFANSTARV